MLLCFPVFLQVRKNIKARVYDGCGFYKNITQLHVSERAHCLLAATGTSQSFSASLFGYLPSLAAQRAIVTSRAAVVVLTEFYFEASGCEDVKRLKWYLN